MTRPLLGLVCMVKNEADNVRATLESALPHVDRWLVTDTGSTDGSKEVVLETMMKSGLIGSVMGVDPILARLRSGKEVFDFGANRNRALELLEEGRDKDEVPVFTIFLSGHETLHVDGDALRTFLEAHRDAPEGAYAVNMLSGSRGWPYTRVLRVDGGWRYAGKIHECPSGPNGEIKGPLIPGVLIVHAPPQSDAERKMQRLREHDLPVLEDIVENDALSLEQRAGAMVFLAETHTLLAAHRMEQCGGNLPRGDAWLSHQMAALALYYRYAQLGEQPDRPLYDPNKVHYALAMYYQLASQVPGLYTHEEILARLERLVMVAPNLPEAHFLRAKHAAQIEDWKKGAKLALGYAIDAAKAARSARLAPTYEVTETSLEWRSLLLASACADRLRQSATSKEDTVMRMSHARRLLEQAVKAGAPASLLAESAPEPEAPL